jgi:hypothetical protein
VQTNKTGDTTPNSRPVKDITGGISLLLGDPKKAIVKLSGPMIVAMLLMSTYNIVNAIWVAGLGSDALAAVGFVTPLFLILIGMGSGLGAGIAWSSPAVSVQKIRLERTIQRFTHFL